MSGVTTAVFQQVGTTPLVMLALMIWSKRPRTTLKTCFSLSSQVGIGSRMQDFVGAVDMILDKSSLLMVHSVSDGGL